ncbi:MAG: hypothetical protein SWZ49_27150, partial [Cyanobacteriota bacterium]|nr:hypothetical protein [Cyanobacteriota bacterium]
KLRWCRVIPAKTQIHVNRNNIGQNTDKEPEDLIPVISVKNRTDNVYGYSVKINGPCEIIYRPQKPLDCHATLWVETFSQVQVQLTNPNKKSKQQPNKKSKSNLKLVGDYSFLVNAC